MLPLLWVNFIGLFEDPKLTPDPGYLQILILEGASTELVKIYAASPTNLAFTNRPRFFCPLLPRRTSRGSWEVVWPSLPPTSHPYPSPLLQNPTVMPRINAHPTMMVELKEAMISTGKKVLRLRSAQYQSVR